MSSLVIRPYVLGDLNTNCYLLWDDESREAIIIDPADNGTFLSEQLLEQELEPLALVCTHGHFDHVLASFELQLNFELPLYLHPNDQAILAKARSSAEHWLGHTVDPVPAATHVLQEGLQIQVGVSFLEVWETPGHTPGSVSLVVSSPTSSGELATTAVFSGDTVFHQAVGRTDHSYSSPLALEESLHRLTTQLPQSLLVYPGHGEATTVGQISAWLKGETDIKSDFMLD